MSSLNIAVSFAVALNLFLQSFVLGDPAKPCHPDICRLPDCFCSGTEIPGNLSLSSIPQIVFVTSDAAINAADFFDYEKLFDGSLKNPNGCNISGTFFVSHEYTNYCEVQDLYSQRHEIADNSISRRLPILWWANATEKEQKEEIGGMKEMLQKWGNVKAEDMKGYRAPYIQVGGNTEFKVLRDLGFMYESSMPTQWFIDLPLWPYTLDYRSTQDCEIQPCPTDSFPGLWEVPLVDYYDTKGKLCNFVLSCTPPASVEEVIELFESNFQLHYTTNRAPFFMLLSAEWLQNNTYLEGTRNFLSKLTTMGNVWIVTVSQGLEWIKNPTTLDKIEDFEPWKCDSPAPPPCPDSQCKECYYADRQRSMSTCAPACPPHYPWVGNPDGN